jgi:hypothetical protein
LYERASERYLERGACEGAFSCEVDDYTFVSEYRDGSKTKTPYLDRK